jgi:hypothetical protein
VFKITYLCNVDLYTSRRQECIVSGDGCILVATGYGCIATRYGCIATGDGCIAAGDGCIVTGDGCVATGYGCIATGNGCIAPFLLTLLPDGRCSYHGVKSSRHALQTNLPWSGLGDEDANVCRCKELKASSLLAH